MTEAEIREKIRYNERLIDQFANEKRGIEKDLEDLEGLRNKFNTLQNKFSSKQEERQGKLSLFLTSSISNTILNKYFNGMNSLLNSKEFNNTYNGLSEAKRKISNELRKLLQELEECEDKIDYRKNRRDYWKRQLIIKQNQEEG